MTSFSLKSPKVNESLGGEMEGTDRWEENIEMQNQKPLQNIISPSRGTQTYTSLGDRRTYLY